MSEYVGPRYGYDEEEGFFVEMTEMDEHGEGRELTIRDVVALLNAHEASEQTRQQAETALAKAREAVNGKPGMRWPEEWCPACHALRDGLTMTLEHRDGCPLSALDPTKVAGENRDTAMRPERYLAVCECATEGVVVLFYEPTSHPEDDDIALSTWHEWKPNTLGWRIRQAWAVLTEREKVAEWGVLLSRAEARALAEKLLDFASRPLVPSP